jgi:hypothetical protein
MVRLSWFLVAVVLALAGGDALIRGMLGWAGWFVVGIGLGIGCAVIGSWVHDALGSARERLQ